MATLSCIGRICPSRTLASRPITGAFAPKRFNHKKSNSFLVSEEVQQAVSENRPVVALESTIYTHGFPYPDNLHLASRLESLVRENGGVPATIAILNGIARVGLGPSELARLVETAGSATTLKVSRRDLGFALALRDAEGRRLNGGTTVSATMILAHLAGINIFATGGLGGVHRGAEHTMDVSADLTELGRTPVAVISSGCKSFLDIPKTLEYLETQGVAVATFADGRRYGEVDFPAFYTRESGVKSPQVIRDEYEAAQVIYASKGLNIQSGLLFANPIPEQHSVPFLQMEVAIAEALDSASAAGATGAASTPYILAKIKEITGSKSVEANKALVEANVVRGTKVAVALSEIEENRNFKTYADLRTDTSSVMTGPASSSFTASGVKHSTGASTDASEVRSQQWDPRPTEQPVNVFVAGSLAVDLACDYSPRSDSNLDSPELLTSNPARITQLLGGVGHNVARAAHLMGASVRLCSAVGDDLPGKAALEALAGAQLSSAGIKTFPSSSGSRTAQYIAINDKNKDLVLAMADMSILETTSTISSTIKEFWLPQLHSFPPSHLVLDGNWPPESLFLWLTAAAEIPKRPKILFEPVSTTKSTRPFQTPKPLSLFPNPSIDIITPNNHELTAMHTYAREQDLLSREDWFPIIDALGIPSTGARVPLTQLTTSALVDAGTPQMTLQLLPFFPTIATKLGPAGVLLTQILPADDERLRSAEHAQYILSRCNNGTESTLGLGGVYMRLFPAVEHVPAQDIVSVNGVGDTFAGTLVAGLARGKKVEELIDLAQRAAVLSLKSAEAVSPELGKLRGQIS